jgi:hypothetical protein
MDLGKAALLPGHFLDYIAWRWHWQKFLELSTRAFFAFRVFSKAQGMGILSWRTENIDHLCMDVRALWITSKVQLISEKYPERLQELDGYMAIKLSR